MIKTFTILCTVVLILIIGVLNAVTQNESVSNQFVLKDDGFYPRTITIDIGGTVTFLNKSSHAFWPASDNHPDHSLYEGFDAGHPIKPGESWTFTFEKEGVWWLHDHLRPYFRAHVIVGNPDISQTCLTSFHEQTTVAEKQACWERELANVLEEDSVQAAFQLFSQLYSEDSDFSLIGCHWMAHKLGEAEYGVYLQHHDLNKLEFPPETVYCGYGYYHGFLEHFLRDNPDYEFADNFCKTLIPKLEATEPRIRLNCYHAIGHGFVPEPVDIETWGNPEKLVAPALEACKKILVEDARHECLQGTFNVIADWMWNNQFGLYYSDDNPLKVCVLFDDYETSSSCYYEVSMRLNPSVDNNIVRAYTTYIAQIPDEKIAGTVLNSFAASALGQRILEDDFSDLVLECRKIPEFLHIDCMKGLTGAFIAHGEPEKEYIKAIHFCHMDMLTDKEKDVCYWNIIRTFKGAYTKEKVGEVCQLIENPYQKYCLYEE